MNNEQGEKAMNEENTVHMSPTIGALAAALAKAQGTMRHALKDEVNPHFKQKYANLAGVIDACREPLATNGLAFSQITGLNDQGATVKTMLIHSSGEWLASDLTVPLFKRDAQGVGSALTYARRYALSAIAGVTQDDDDGNSASERVGGNPMRGKPARSNSDEDQRGDHPPPEDEPATAGEAKRGPTAVLLELRAKILACETAFTIPTVLADYNQALEKLPKRARETGLAFGRARMMELEGKPIDPKDAAMATVLNEMASD